MLGGEQETKADILQHSVKDFGSVNNRRELKRKRDDEDSNQPVSSGKLMMDGSQQSNAAMVASKRQRISYSKSKAKTKKRTSDDDVTGSGSSSQSVQSVDAKVWSQKSVKGSQILSFVRKDCYMYLNKSCLLRIY